MEGGEDSLEPLRFARNLDGKPSIWHDQKPKKDNGQEINSLSCKVL